MGDDGGDGDDGDDGGGSGRAWVQGVVEKIEDIEADMARLRESRKDVFERSKGLGLDNKVVRQMVRERAMDAGARAEFARKCQIYRAALGILDGTPLGEAARRSFERKDEAPAKRSAPADAPPAGSDAAPAKRSARADAPPPVEDTPEARLAARAQGAAAAKAGRKVTENPFGADDPRRASWDEGWCAEAGSDGMDIPAAFRRRSGDAPKKKRGGKKGDDTQPGGAA